MPLVVHSQPYKVPPWLTRALTATFTLYQAPRGFSSDALPLGAKHFPLVLTDCVSAADVAHAMSHFLLATGGYDSTVRIFDAQNTNLLRTINFSDSQVLQLAFSGVGPVAYDERLILAVAGSPRVSLYDVSLHTHYPNPVFIFENHQGPVTAIGFDPCRSPRFVFSASEDGTLQVWRASAPPLPTPPPSAPTHPTGTPTPSPAQQPPLLPSLPQPPPPPPPHGAPAVAPPTGQTQPPLRGSASSVIATFRNRDPINAAVFCGARQLFFTADTKGRIRVWDLAAQKRVAEAVPHVSHRHIQTLELSSDESHLVAANADGRVFVYEVADLVGSPERPPMSEIRAAEENTYITRTRLSVDCKELACTLSSGVVKVFHMEDVISRHQEERNDQYGEVDTEITPWRCFQAHIGWVWDAVFVGDASKYLFTCSTSAQVFLWNLDDEVQTSTEYVGHNKAVVCLAIKEQYAADPPVTIPIGPEEL